MPSPLPLDELKQIQDAWNQAADMGKELNAQALGLRRNFRFGVFPAFKAAWHAAKAVYQVGEAVAIGNIMPWDVFEIAEGVYHAVTDALDALYEWLTPLEYVTCIVLGSEKEGLTTAELEQRLQEFLNTDPARQDLAWYLRVTQSLLEKAKKELTTTSFDTLKKNLQKKHLLEQTDEKWKFKSCHIAWKLDVLG